jgi:hypothetical protein
VVRDVVNHEWRHTSLYNTANPQAGTKRYLLPKFIQGCSFNFMQPAGQTDRCYVQHTLIMTAFPATHGPAKACG